MRIAMFLVALAGLVAVTVSTVDAGPAEFCNGFEAGYAAGYKRARNTSLAPIPPLCPIQPVKRPGDPQSDFEHGYAVGYEKATKAAN